MLAQEQKILQSTVETIYRVNADDYVRAELDAREDALRVQRTFENELKSYNTILTEQKSKIAEQQTTIDEQQSTIDEQNIQLANKDAEIARLKALLKKN